MARPLDTRRRLLATAADLIWQSSYHATGVDEICQKSGANKGSFYHHFASKEDLAIAAIDEQWREQHKPRMDAIFATDLPPLDRLRRYAREALRIQREKRDEAGRVCGCPLYALGSEIGTQPSQLRAKIEELLARRLAYFAAAVRDAQSRGDIDVEAPERTAQVLLDLVEGALTRARITNDLAPIADLEQAMLLVVGARKEPTRRAAARRAR